MKSKQGCRKVKKFEGASSKMWAEESSPLVGIAGLTDLPYFGGASAGGGSCIPELVYSDKSRKSRCFGALASVFGL